MKKGVVLKCAMPLLRLPKIPITGAFLLSHLWWWLARQMWYTRISVFAWDMCSVPLAFGPQADCYYMQLSVTALLPL